MYSRMWPVLPPSEGGLHCRHAHYRHAHMVNPVLPPSDGGLHCGTIFVTSVNVWVGILPPFDGGPHCGSGVTLSCNPVMTSAPAVRRRAPLRQFLVVQFVVNLDVLPARQRRGSIAAAAETAESP
jgi:hypothetical protein